MNNSFFIIKWPFSTDQTYNYGSKINFKNQVVTFKNSEVSPGGKIHTWQSMVDYQQVAKTLELPLLQSNREYRIRMQDTQIPANSINLQFEFYDLNDQLIDNPVLTSLEPTFVFPENVHHYQLSLINLNNQELKFNYLLIEPQPMNNQINVYSEHFKLVVVTPNHEKDAQKIVIYVKNRLLNSQSYLAVSDQIRIYIEFNGYRDFNDYQIMNLVDQIQFRLKSTLSSVKLPYYIQSMQQPDLTTEKLKNRLIEVLFKVEE